jgi:hypothetical protein
MAARKKAAAKEAAKEAPKADEPAKVMEIAAPSNAGKQENVYRTDLGEAIPAQKPAGVE